jgi:TolB protein
VINAQALVNGQATVGPDGRLRVDFRLWDVLNEQSLLGLQFTATPENWRRIAHKVADAVTSG